MEDAWLSKRLPIRACGGGVIAEVVLRSPAHPNAIWWEIRLVCKARVVYWQDGRLCTHDGGRFRTSQIVFLGKNINRHILPSSLQLEKFTEKPTRSTMAHSNADILSYVHSTDFNFCGSKQTAKAAKFICPQTFSGLFLRRNWYCWALKTWGQIGTAPLSCETARLLFQWELFYSPLHIFPIFETITMKLIDISFFIHFSFFEKNKLKLQ